MTEAVGFVLSEMPVEDSAAALRTFTMPLIQQIHEVTQRPSVGKDDLLAVAGECFFSPSLVQFLEGLRY